MDGGAASYARAVLFFLACADPAVDGPDHPGRERDPHEEREDSEGDSSAGEPGLEVHCAAADATMSVSPSAPETGQRLDVSVTADTGYVSIGMAVTGGAYEQLSAEISGDGPYTWAYAYRLHEAGRFTFTFTADDGATPICEASLSATGETVVDTGEPPTELPHNPIGIGLVSAGDTEQWDAAAKLTGSGGHVKLIFAGVTPGMSGPEASWVTAVQEVQDRDLVPVIRMNPPWGTTDIRSWSDDGDHRVYTSYAASFAAVVDGLPRSGDDPIWIEVLNEPNLCYEWTCSGSGWQGYETTAAEYASLLRDVTAALRALGDDRVRVINAGLAPGGTVSCECGGEGWTGGITSLPFLQAMEAEVPGVFADLDGFASHAYPSSGEGYGFFEPYDDCAAGLNWWKKELDVAGVPGHPVLITETGWTIDNGASRSEVADWTVEAWAKDWSTDSRLHAVMPFMLQDAAWDAFGWIDTSGSPYPVYTAVRDWRCAAEFPEPCS